MSNVNSIKVLPWGEEIFVELPIHKGKSLYKFYVRHGKTSEGREYIEFSKFGPKPNTENEKFTQKLRLYSPTHWAQIKHYVENELANSIGWNLAIAQKDFEESADSRKRAN